MSAESKARPNGVIEMTAADPTPARSTREAWLENAIETLRPRFEEIGHPLPEKVHVSVGFGYGTRAESKNILGQTLKTIASKDGVNHVFLCPSVDDTARILDILIHELIHVALDNEDGHRGRFAEAATRLGLEGPMTATYAGPMLAFELLTMADSLGHYPHGAVDVEALDRARSMPRTPVTPDGSPAPRITSGPAKQGTRMIKVWCPECDYKVRTTQTWLNVAVPTCPNPGCGRQGSAMDYTVHN